jgi:hypothetical protein
LLAHGFDIAGVLTHADDPNETAWFRSVAELAARPRACPCSRRRIRITRFGSEKIRELAPDVLFSFY